ncbi:hypothetical protein SNF32_12210 [Enterococcus mundtii]|nr:hypothetical protein [Enterococcus mundtii]
MLVLEGGSASINELRSSVKLSKSAFDQYIEDLELIGRMMKTKISVRKMNFKSSLN